MCGFIYFASGITNPVTSELIGQLDLAYAFQSLPMHGVVEGRTPSGAAGTLMCDPARMGEWAMAFGGGQVWRKRPGDDCVWIGYWKDSPPTPHSLARAKRLAGDAVTLADGQAWQVPRFWWHAAEDGFQLQLPRYYDLDDAGEWVYGDVDEAFADLKPVADRLLAGVYRTSDATPPLTTTELLAVAPQLLAVNYAVAPLECAMLKLFKRDGSLRRIAELAVDYDQAMAWLEKKTA
jgi:hypothetical protein